MFIYIYIHIWITQISNPMHVPYKYIRKIHKHSRRWQVRHSHMCSECFSMTWFYHNVYE